MGRVLFGIIAAVACFVLVDSQLSCNMCNFGLLGFCPGSSTENCTTNTSVCYTARATFPSLTDFVGFNTQGCREPTGCNATNNGTLLGVTSQTMIECCSTDQCNPVNLSGAPSTKMTLTAVIGAAILASMWGSFL